LSINWSDVKFEILFNFMVNFPSLAEIYNLKVIFIEAMEQQMVEKGESLKINIDNKNNSNDAKEVNTNVCNEMTKVKNLMEFIISKYYDKIGLINF